MVYVIVLNVVHFFQGYRQKDILELIICTDTLVPSSPCGACRQVISELMESDAKITLMNPKLVNTKQYLVKDLLPFAFSGDNLNDESKL